MKKSIGIVIMVLFVLINASKSYAIPIDSLRLAVRSLPDDTLKVIELAKLSKKYSKFQTDTSLKIGNDALKLAQSLKFEYGVAYSFYILGIVNRYYADYDKSIECSERAYEIFENLNNESYKGL